MSHDALSGDQFNGVTITRGANSSTVSGGGEEDRSFTIHNASSQGHYYDAEAHGEGRVRRAATRRGVSSTDVPIRRRTSY